MNPVSLCENQSFVSHPSRRNLSLCVGIVIRQEMTENEIGTFVIDAAIAVHRELGPGLFEPVYEVALAHELSERGLKGERQVPISISYREIKFDEGVKADLVVESKVILELKSVESVGKVHKKQLLTYLKLSGLKLGYLLNFGEALMKDGITRIVNGELE